MVLSTGIFAIILSALAAVSGATNSTHASSATGFVSSAYYANWDGSNFPISKIPVQYLSHIVYAFANVGTDGTVSSSDTATDITNAMDGDDTSEAGKNVYGNFKQLYLLKQKNRKLKITLSVGGGGSPGWKNIGDSDFSATFVKTAVQMVADFGLDGLDCDFEFPSSANIAAYADLISALRTGLDGLSNQLNTSPFSISIAVAGDIPDDQAYQNYIKKIDPVITWWHVMAYDLCAPTYQSTACDIGNLKGGSTSGSGTIQWFLNNGASASKIVLGSPLYGYVFEGTAGHDDSYDSSKTPAGDGNNGPGGYSVKDLPLSSMTDAQVTEDTTNGASWAYSKDTQTLASYDTPTIAQLKANYIIQENWAGSMYWEISNDNTTPDTSLVAQYASVFGKGAGLDTTCNHIGYTTSQYDNIKNNMGSTPASCDDSTLASNSNSDSDDGDSSDASSTTTPSSVTTEDTSTGNSSSGGQCQATRRRRVRRDLHKRRNTQLRTRHRSS